MKTDKSKSLHISEKTHNRLKLYSVHAGKTIGKLVDEFIVFCLDQLDIEDKKK